MKAFHLKINTMLLSLNSAKNLYMLMLKRMVCMQFTSALHTCGHESRAVAACMGGAP